MQYGRPERLPNISIHALRKESDVLADMICLQERISIHALRKESDHGTPFG